MIASALNGANAAFLADQYRRWVRDPGSVDQSFATLFDALGDEDRAILGDTAGVTWKRDGSGLDLDVAFSPAESGQVSQGQVSEGQAPQAGSASPEALHAALRDSLRAQRLVAAWRAKGHLAARLDPLGLRQRTPDPELDPAWYGFTAADLSRTVWLGETLTSLMGCESATLGAVVETLRTIYAGTAGVEYAHIADATRREWIRSRVEHAALHGWADIAARRTILQQLTEAEGFETFCAKRYVGVKRFGLEGGEITIPALHAIIGEAVTAGVGEVVIGMPHRGRLNTLVNIVRKPFVAMFSEFAGASFKPDDVAGSGDVKYHLGSSTDLDLEGHVVHVSLQPNPSHLEAVDPVVAGKVRARQDAAGDTEARRSVLGIIMHGDAAFAGQGIVYETLAMSELSGYRTGGTIHLVVNNQIGFTTNPCDGYSGLYGTDIARSIQAPVFHVNGDDAEAVVFFARLAAAYRQTFGSDAVLDIVCYRRHGHNESDEPAFTQPVMYKAIRTHETARTLYARKLVADGVLTEAEAQAGWDAFQEKMDSAYTAAQTYKPNKADWLEGCWSGLRPLSGADLADQPVTGMPAEVLRSVGAALSTVPGTFDVNPKIARQLAAKAAMFESGEGFDWATGEALAFGALLVEGHAIRLSGEDCKRGTFSHRHAVLTDQTTQAEYTPLNHVRDLQARIEVHNSLLSEFAVLGYEYGYTMAAPQTLVLWEAQFGDFANGAQVIIDQFIAAGETKWLRMSGLVLLLPHGYEGQGPEHSSARLERYLQLCAEDNMFVCNLTTPANYFHALRRQIVAEYRKPLIVMAPKSLLRHRLATSTLAEMGAGTRFRPVLEEIDPIDPARTRRVVLCSGKVYYDLLAERRARKLEDVAILRLEQIYPFPERDLAEALKPYAGARVVWCQEEPQNMGGWQFVDRRIETVLRQVGNASDWPGYAGRMAAASPATGSARVHAEQQARLINAALGVA
ncbi:2-oxoglutarate dehydrogenase E1 component [Acidomonas methanolica]|uniref:2-oxoglutarate dehydrogenase E1 component n=1 Tax=Acidomonas methanolica TaxID=437 RepID=UPI00351D407C